jgi:predicted chitinase
MADFNYDMFSLGNTAKEKLREVSQEGAVPTGIGAKPADEQEPMDKGFYESMYEAIMSYFDKAEDADRVLTAKEIDKDRTKEEVLREFDALDRLMVEDTETPSLDYFDEIDVDTREEMTDAQAKNLREVATTEFGQPLGGGLKDVTDTEEGKLTNEEPLYELAEDIDPGTIDTGELDVDGVQPTDGKGLMSPTLSSTERSALSDRGSEVNISRSYKITDDTDRYSNEQLNQAVDKTIRNPIKKALLAGTIDVEVGDNGPVTEGAGYRLARAYEMFDDSVVNEALASLPEEEQKRIRDGEASNALGMAIFDRRYDGGSAYRGRGLIQITGRSNYQAVQNILQEQGIDIDLVNNPELVNDNRYALPAALAFLEHAGMTDSVAEDMSTKRLNNMINSGANREIAEERWDSVISTLRAAGLDDEADKLELRNEYQAQETVGTTVDGAIGPNSRTAMRSWLQENNITIPEDATDMDLVVLVNRNA